MLPPRRSGHERGAELVQSFAVLRATATTAAPGTSSRLLDHDPASPDRPRRPCHGDDPALDPEQPEDREVLVRLRLGALGCVDHEQEEVDPARPGTMLRTNRSWPGRRPATAAARQEARAARSRGQRAGRRQVARPAHARALRAGASGTRPSGASCSRNRLRADEHRARADPGAMPLTVGTAGHIDHGKTWLVRALTGKDTDRLPEEKERGISIDLGYAPLDLPDGTRLSLIDVPGHERFIRNMVAGATRDRPLPARDRRRRGRPAADARAPRDPAAARDRARRRRA